MVKKGVLIGSIVAAVVAAVGLSVLIWWLVTRGDDDVRFETIPLEGDGFGNIEHRAAFTRIPGSGNLFWWFYPSLAGDAATRPIVLWLDGVTGLPPSLLANFGMFGPFDFNLNRRTDSWIDEYNLLFVDAPLGSGFSSVLDSAEIPDNTAKNTEHLLLMLESFYEENSDFVDAPLYIFGQGYGAQFALSLAQSLIDTNPTDTEETYFSPNLKGVVLGNPIISPALALTSLGFYLEELGYIDGAGRTAVENYAETTLNLVNQGQLENAYENFLALGEFVNENAGAVAVNLGHIVEKLTNAPLRDLFGQAKYLKDVSGFNDIESFMSDTVAPALGIADVIYDSRREEIIEAFKGTFMEPSTNKVEDLLQNSNITITIYNGNLDAVSTTPGQLQWVEDLSWSGQNEFLNSSRQTLVVNRLVEGYFQETDRLKFYWMNAAGVSVPLDSPVAMRRVLQRIMDE